MIKLVHIGKIAIPKLASMMSRMAEVEKKYIKKQIEYSEVAEITYIHEVRQEMEGRVRRGLGLISPCKGSTFLCFGNVGDHIDDWGMIKLENGRWAEVGFLHVVLKGSGYIRSGGKSVHVKRGDVFMHNPNATHSFEKTSRGFCMTMCMQVPIVASSREMKKPN